MNDEAISLEEAVRRVQEWLNDARPLALPRVAVEIEQVVSALAYRLELERGEVNIRTEP